MKKTIFIILLALSYIINLNAQQVKVTYSEKLSLGDSPIEGMDENVRAMIQSQLKNNIKKKYLYHNQGESVYKAAPVKEEEQLPISSGNITIKGIRTAGNDANIYKNQQKNESISQEAIFDRTFIVKEDLSRFNWVLEDEEKTIQGYNCKKAIPENSQVTVWYCPDIPISDGPSYYSGLPGLILEVETDKWTITVEEIDFSADTEGEIKAPKQGKKVTREEYNKLREKKMEELPKSSNGLSGSIKTIIM